MAKRGVLYLITGTRHAVVLVASLWSLRRHWDGPIHVAVGDEAAEAIVRRAAADPRLAPHTDTFTWNRWKPPAHGRGSTYFAKTFMLDLSPFDETVYLDADTLVCRSFELLFDFQPHAVTLTQFASWTTQGRKMRGRIARYRDASPADAQEMLARRYPAINTGVVAFDRSPGAHSFFDDWQATTAKKISFICDELACQLIFWRHSVRVVDDRWNYSPIHSLRRSDREEPAICHFHGKKHLRRSRGAELWIPTYDECVSNNVAGISEWSPAGDKHLAKFLAERRAAEHSSSAGTTGDKL